MVRAIIYSIIAALLFAPCAVAKQVAVIDGADRSSPVKSISAETTENSTHEGCLDPQPVNHQEECCKTCHAWLNMAAPATIEPPQMVGSPDGAIAKAILNPVTSLKETLDSGADPPFTRHAVSRHHCVLLLLYNRLRI